MVLVGNPNSGKSSLFNLLTGVHQKVSNVTGTTIDKRTGYYTDSKGQKVRVTDTPGMYSLDSESPDEVIAKGTIVGEGGNKADLILYVADSSNLQRHLYLFSQVAELGIETVLVLNMPDQASKRGINIDVARLESELGVHVIEVNARLNEGITGLKRAIQGPQFKVHYPFTDESSNDEEITRYDRIKVLLDKCVQVTPVSTLWTRRIDEIVLHGIWGIPILLAILFLTFQSVFKLAEHPMSWIESGFDLLSSIMQRSIGIPWLNDLVVNGVLAGLSGILVFLPQIAILFFFLNVLEETGYLARISFVLDRVLRAFGMNGKSVIPLMSGAACAIPAVMAARSIPDWKSRIITIMVTPLMSCSARLPVYTLIIGIMIPGESSIGPISIQGLALLGMYFVGTVMSLLVALIFKWFIKDRSRGYLIQDLPDYRPPRWKSVFLVLFNKSKSFVVEAGKIIFIMSVLVWFLSSFKFDSGKIVQTASIENSMIGALGHFIEPVITPLGYNWKIGIAILTSLVAREVFVGTMATLYSVGGDGSFASIKSAMMSEINPITGEMVFSTATLISLLLFYAFAMQCFSTLAVVYKETGKIKWPLIQLAYMTALAYISSMLAFQLLA